MMRRLSAVATAVAVLLSLLVTGSVAAAEPTPDELIQARYDALGGPGGPLGAPAAPPEGDGYDVTGGRARDFASGAIYWVESLGEAWEVYDPAIRTRHDALGGPDGRLGLPAGAPGDLEAGSAGRVQRFTGGRVFWSGVEGAAARDLNGAVLARYLRLGGPAGGLGWATSNQRPAGVAGSQMAVFERGRIYWSASTGARDVRDRVLRLYLAKGGPRGPLGLPRRDHRAIQGGWRTYFEHGVVLQTTRYGARALWGRTYTRYRAIGGIWSYLGFPTSNEYRVKGGVRNRFVRGNITSITGGKVVVRGAWKPRVGRVTAAQIPYTYRSGCPVGPAGLRRVHMPYYDWAGVPQYGKLIVRSWAADDMKRVFRRAFAKRFPIRRMNPVDIYGGSDVRAMAADNTSAFNCRKVTGNPYRLSQHSYGNAIDINTVENPYVTSSRVYPEAGRQYLNRSRVRKGMIVSGSPIARRMRVEGWSWGARWSNPDYQHFSSNGG